MGILVELSSITVWLKLSCVELRIMSTHDRFASSFLSLLMQQPLELLHVFTVDVSTEDLFFKLGDHVFAQRANFICHLRAQIANSLFAEILSVVIIYHNLIFINLFGIFYLLLKG
jgi:hypothetical protein